MGNLIFEPTDRGDDTADVKHPKKTFPLHRFTPKPNPLRGTNLEEKSDIKKLRGNGALLLLIIVKNIIARPSPIGIVSETKFQ